VRRAIIDTAHFKYNASAAVALSGCATEEVPDGDSPDWLPLLDRARLQPDTRHIYDLGETDPVTFVRLEAFPDGGLSRVRLIGAIDPAARRAAGFRWFNVLPASQAAQCLAHAGIPAELAAGVISDRPLSEGWLGAQLHSEDSPRMAALAGMLEGQRR